MDLEQSIAVLSKTEKLGQENENLKSTMLSVIKENRDLKAKMNNFSRDALEELTGIGNVCFCHQMAVGIRFKYRDFTEKHTSIHKNRFCLFVCFFYSNESSFMIKKCSVLFVLIILFVFNSFCLSLIVTNIASLYSVLHPHFQEKVHQVWGKTPLKRRKSERNYSKPEDNTVPHPQWTSGLSWKAPQTQAGLRKQDIRLKMPLGSNVSNELPEQSTDL